MKLYMYGTVPLSIIRALITVHSAMIYVIQVCREQNSTKQTRQYSITKFAFAVYKPV